MTTALLIVDVQNDFIDGTLAVPDAEAITQPIAELSHAYEYVVASRDFHPERHMSFVEGGGMWPRHCVQGTKGAEFHPAIKELQPTNVYKGTNIAVETYSAYHGHVFGGPSFRDWLHLNGVDCIDICGLALDYCVRATALDVKAAGFETRVLLDLTRPVTWTTGAQAIIDLLRANIKLVTA